MDGKYAKYIKNFMQSFKINGETLEIQTEYTKKNKPLKYKLTKDRIAECNDKLDTEYQIVVDNKEKIEKVLTKKANVTVAIAAAVITFGCFIPQSEVIYVLILKLATIILGSLIATSWVTQLIKIAKFEKFINIVQEYKKHRQDIEKTMEKDENITKYLSEDTHQMLSEKTKLLATGKTTEILDIDFMDKLLDKKSKGRKELITLLNMYKAVIGLREEPKYRESKKVNTSPKKRSRIKEENK